MNPIHIDIHFFTNHFNIIFPLTPSYPKWFFSLRLPSYNFVCIPNLSNSCYIFCRSGPLNCSCGVCELNSYTVSGGVQTISSKELHYFTIQLTRVNDSANCQSNYDNTQVSNWAVFIISPEVFGVSLSSFPFK